MSKNLLALLAITSLMLSACGDDYKAIKGIVTGSEKPTGTERLADPEVEEKALEILKDAKFAENNSETIREDLIATITGATTVIFESETTGNYHVEMTVGKFDPSESDVRIGCSPTTKLTPEKHKTYLSTTWIDVPGVYADGKAFNRAQVRCVTASCESMVLVLENIIKINTVHEDKVERGAVAILLSVKDSTGGTTVYYPVKTASNLFLYLPDANSGREVCEKSGSKTDTDDQNSIEVINDNLDTTAEFENLDGSNVSQQDVNVIQPAVIRDEDGAVEELPDGSREEEVEFLMPEAQGDHITTQNEIEDDSEQVEKPVDTETLRLKQQLKAEDNTMPAIFPEDEQVDWIDKEAQGPQ